MLPTVRENDGNGSTALRHVRFWRASDVDLAERRNLRCRSKSAEEKEHCSFDAAPAHRRRAPLSALSNLREIEQKASTTSGEDLRNNLNRQTPASAGNGVGEDSVRQGNHLFWSCLRPRLKSYKRDRRITNCIATGGKPTSVEDHLLRRVASGYERPEGKRPFPVKTIVRKKSKPVFR